MAPILTSLSPNTERSDVLQALRTLAMPWTWKKKNIVASLEESMKKYFTGKEVVLTSSGRQALYDILHAIGVNKGDEVIMQAFTCIAVPEPVLWLEAKPIYADIIPETFNLDPEDVRKKITPRTKAIIVQHTFGIPGPISELQNIAQEHNLVLIEDCAHALGNEYHEQPLGTFGDAAILSFGRDKMLSSVFGGAVVTKNSEWIEKLRQYQNERTYPPFIWVKQQLFHPLLFSLFKKTYFTAHVGKILLVAFQRLRFLSKAVEQRERVGKMPRHIQYRYSPALAQLLHCQWEKLIRYTGRRKAIGEAYANTIGLRASNIAWLRYPALVEDPAELHAKARAEHILLGDWYDAPLVPAAADFAVFAYVPGSCPQAETTAKHVINLPTYPTMSEEQVQKMIRFIKTYIFNSHANT